MKFIYVLTSFLVVVLARFSYCVDNNNLVTVIVLYRHGARSPEHLYPNDPYIDEDKYWPDGLGQLTNIGKNQGYQLGLGLRKRYNGFIPEKYNHKDIYIFSTDLERTLMSAYCVLAAFYQPRGDQIWNPNLNWQPIPVHTEPVLEDLLLRVEAPCKKYSQLSKDLQKTPYYVNMEKLKEDLFGYLKNKTDKEMLTIQDLNDLYDTLLIEKETNKRLPEWTKTVFPQPLQKFSTAFFLSMAYNNDLAKIKVGAFYQEIEDHFLNCTTNTDGICYKMRQYSGHDSNIYNMLHTLGVRDIIRIQYANALMFELRKKDSGYFVNVLYKNGTILEKINITDCDFDCDLHNFKKIFSPIMLRRSEWHKECQNSPNAISTLLIVLIMLISIAVMILLIFGSLYLKRYQKRSTYNMKS